jgi:CRP-like cAMP-binding protein
MSGIHFVQKLKAFNSISNESEAAIQALAARRTKTLRAGEDLISEGDDPRTIYLILEGWACRYKTLDDGRQQLLAYFVPGDMCDLYVYILDQMDHSIGAITAVKYASIKPEELDDLCDGHPRVMRALWWESLVAASIQREWLVSAGQRSAYEALAHLCCELHFRLKQVGLTDKGHCAFPLTQANIADALGLTQPHVSRVVGELNRSGMVTLRRHVLIVHDLPGLIAVAGFNPNYLHYR